ncbi:MAG TPA: hypothetical protein VI564_02785 [Candidatus Nanoarchaeia archaeon]|nr:hypothetical protein [Candidatus Nanoarchaeia archaeon]
MPFLCLAIVSAATPLLNVNEIGFNGQTRNNNYDELVNGMYSNGKVTTTIGDKLWVPWFKTSSGCQQSDLQSGNNCNSGQGIDFTHNCMVTDEFSQVGVLASMGKDQNRMNQFYNTVIATKSTFGNIPAWRIYRNGDTIEPCKSGINGNCDTASDATARIIIALYTGANNPYFTDSAKKQEYKNLANQLSADMLANEVEQKCYPSTTGYGNICYWMAGGSQVKKGGFSSNDYAYTGYFAEGIQAMLMACSQTGNQKYCDVARHFTLNFLQAAKWNSNSGSFTAPPGLAFRWSMDSNGVPQAVCTRNCNPVEWDFADAPRAFGMCQANYYAKQMNIGLPGLDKYCALWGDRYAKNTNSIVIQYKPDGSAAASAQSGYYYQGLQALFQPGYNQNLFKQTLDNALSHYTTSTRTWDNAPCFGVYTQTFAMRALGMGLGRDLGVFSDVGYVPPVDNSQPSPSSGGTVITGPLPQQSPPPATQQTAGIAGLSATCTAGNSPCSVKSDSTSGTCRSVVFSTFGGEIKIAGCEKSGGYVEVYRQAYPSGMNFKACLDKGCIDQLSGFSRFLATYTSPTTTSTSGTTSTTTSPTPAPAPAPTTGSVLDVSKLSITAVPSGNLVRDYMEGTSCRKVQYNTPAGWNEAKVCQKSDHYEMYLLSAPNPHPCPALRHRPLVLDPS